MSRSTVSVVGVNQAPTRLDAECEGAAREGGSHVRSFGVLRYGKKTAEFTTAVPENHVLQQLFFSVETLTGVNVTASPASPARIRPAPRESGKSRVGQHGSN